MIDDIINSHTYTCYTWVNGLYLNDKQFGIQTAHCISDMSIVPDYRPIYERWARNHKKIVVFDGTNSGTIRNIFTIIADMAFHFQDRGIYIPAKIFKEDGESLDGATTACGIIIPDIMRMFSWKKTNEHSYPTYLNQFAKIIHGTTEIPKINWEDKSELIEIDRLNTADYIKNFIVPGHPFRLENFAVWMDSQRLA